MGSAETRTKHKGSGYKRPRAVHKRTVAGFIKEDKNCGMAVVLYWVKNPSYQFPTTIAFCSSKSSAVELITFWHHVAVQCPSLIKTD
jgi:hypothetical protein